MVSIMVPSVCAEISLGQFLVFLSHRPLVQSWGVAALSRVVKTYR